MNKEKSMKSTNINLIFGPNPVILKILIIDINLGQGDYSKTNHFVPKMNVY